MALPWLRRRERILGGVYDGDAWVSHLAERKQIGERVDARGEAEPEVDGYLWSLTETYRASIFYFEIFEYEAPPPACLSCASHAPTPVLSRYALQKLTLVGLLVFFQPGSLEQLTLGLIVCFVYFGLCCYLQPFGSKADNLMVSVTQFSLFVAMLAAIIIEHGSPDTPQSVVTILIVAALTPFALSLLLTIQLLFNELGIHPLGLCWRPVERALMRRTFASSAHRVCLAPSPTHTPPQAAGGESATPTQLFSETQLQVDVMQEIEALRLRLQGRRWRRGRRREVGRRRSGAGRRRSSAWRRCCERRRQQQRVSGSLRRRGRQASRRFGWRRWRVEWSSSLLRTCHRRYRRCHRGCVRSHHRRRHCRFVVNSRARPLARRRRHRLLHLPQLLVPNVTKI